LKHRRTRPLLQAPFSGTYLAHIQVRNILARCFNTPRNSLKPANDYSSVLHRKARDEPLRSRDVSGCSDVPMTGTSSLESTDIGIPGSLNNDSDHGSGEICLGMVWTRTHCSNLSQSSY
jgi:hypothetical protein